MKYENLSRIDQTKPAAEDSYVVVADVRGSTAAIKEGRYRDVNLAGAACVAAMRNVFSPLRVPYVFGGDGATFLVGAGDLDLCIHILRGVQELSQATLGLSLMVGYMSMKEIRGQGADVHYGFLSWSKTEHLPYFRGNGISLAETTTKRLDAQIPTKEFGDDANNANLDGLSCRLLPFKALRGRVLSILIEPCVDLKEEDSVLEEVFTVLKRGGPLSRLRPVSLMNERRPWLSSTWRSEAAIHSKGRCAASHLAAQAKTIFESLLGTFLFRYNIKNPILGTPSEYTQEMLNQSDWIKMDGTLRLVVDLTAEEERELIQTLELLSADKKNIYGLHASAATVMTCHFQSHVGHEHAHFIDGEGGGLSLAAVQLKQKKSILDLTQKAKRGL